MRVPARFSHSCTQISAFIFLLLHSPINSFALFAKNISAPGQECAYQVFVGPCLPDFSPDSVIVGNAGSTSTPYLGCQQGWGAAKGQGPQQAQRAGRGKWERVGRDKTKFAQGGANRWKGGKGAAPTPTLTRLAFSVSNLYLGSTAGR